MQVMPRTARELGYSDLYNPENGIAAGIAYMGWLQARFPGDIPMEERIYFTLAAYNAGSGHVRDARLLAQQLGKDPDRWFGNVEEAMLLLSKRKYYSKANFGYVRGSEPVNYVKDIRERYLAYLSVK
jgi:membrane-bound lytic murein transglycosylase F